MKNIILFALASITASAPLAAADEKIYANAELFTDPFADTITVEGGGEWDGKYNMKLGGLYQSVDSGAESVSGAVVTIGTTLESGLRLKGRIALTDEGLHGSLYARRNGMISMEAYCDHEYVATAPAIRRGIDSTGCSLTAETPDSKPLWAALTGDYHDFSDGNRRTMAALSTRYRLSESFAIAHRSRLLGYKFRAPEYFSPDKWHRHQVTLQHFGKYARGSYKLEAGPGLDFINGNRAEFGVVSGAIFYDYKKTSLFARATHQFGSSYNYSQFTVGASIPF
jgi:hypothetical protein